MASDAIVQNERFDQLKARLIEVNDLESTVALLGWDQSTYMPPGGAAARARQLATLGRLAHEKRTDPAIGALLDELQPWAEDLPYDSGQASLVRVARRQYERATQVPAEFMARFYAHTAELYGVWEAARPENDFAAVRPYLEKTLDLSREMADYYPGYEHIADPLIDQADYGIKAAEVRQIFADLRQELVPLVQAITAQPLADDACLRDHYPIAGQTAFLDQVIEAFGYDLKRGRHDVSAHPFTTKFSLGDVRITVRYDEHNLSEAMFSAMHEAGHAMYEQGIDPVYEGTPLADGTSSGVHESQSRLWENVVGRSRGFWQHWYPRLQAVFPDQLANVSLDTFYGAINRVEPSLIRTDADEVTYNLHVMLRFDFELAMLEGSLAVRDLPDAWHARFASDLGIAPPDDVDGVLQDVHWFFGTIGGMFQGYTLGNILSIQFYEAALDAHPEIPAQIERGEFETLHRWLIDNVYRHGSKYTPTELVERATGGPLRIAPYVAYLRQKYGALYAL